VDNKLVRCTKNSRLIGLRQSLAGNAHKYFSENTLRSFAVRPKVTLVRIGIPVLLFSIIAIWYGIRHIYVRHYSYSLEADFIFFRLHYLHFLRYWKKYFFALYLYQMTQRTKVL